MRFVAILISVQLMGICSCACGGEPPKDIVITEEQIKQSTGMDWKEYNDESRSIRFIRRLFREGENQRALEMANEELLSNPGNRFGRLIRADINRIMGNFREAEADLDYLIKKHPSFKMAYYHWAQLLLVQKISQGEIRHPLLEWLNSMEPEKKKAAQLVVLDLIFEHQEPKGDKSDEAALPKKPVKQNDDKSSEKDGPVPDRRNEGDAKDQKE